MKKSIALVCLLFLVIGCHTSTIEKPASLIDKDKMTEILYDMSLLEAIKTQNINGGISNKAANEYIYKKYKIDSIQFIKSNKYYASNMEEYKKMFEKIKERLNKEVAKTDVELKKNGQPVPPNLNNTSNTNTPQVQ